MTTNAEPGTVNYKGKSFEVVQSSIIMGEQQAPPPGIVMETMTFQCPMVTRDARGRPQTCGAWIEIVLEFVPSAWFCPACGGMMVVDAKAESRQYELSHLSFDVSDSLRAFCYMAESMQQENMPKIMQWLDERVEDWKFQATGYDPESQQWLNQTIGAGQVSITRQFHALEDLGLSPTQATTASRRPSTDSVMITDVAALDQLINDGLDLRDRSALSPQMSQLLDAYSAASAAMGQGDPYKATRRYREIISKWPNFVAPRVNMGLCMMLMGEHGQALQQLEQAHDLAPSDPDIHIATGRVHEALGNKQAELQQYRHALLDDPTHVEAMTCLGITYREIGEFEESYHWLGQALERIEREERASSHFGWQHPFKLNTLAGIAETCEASGDWRRALQCWERAKAVAPHDSRIDACIRQARRKARWSWLPGRR